MEKIKTIPSARINKIKNNPETAGLAFRQYGKSEDIKDYSDREISEMILGIYKDSRYLLVEDYFVDLNKVISSKCILERVTYYKKPSLDDYRYNYHNHITNIRTFYIKDYFLITNEEICGKREHRITGYLHRIGFLNQGRGDFRGLYSVANIYGTMLFGKYPKDLFHPVKRYINGMFFQDDYRISEFVFESTIQIDFK